MNRVVIVVIVLAVLAIAGWWRSELKAAESRGQARLLAHQADSAFAALEDSATSWAAREAAYDSARQAMSSDLERLKGIARVAQENASEAILVARSRISALSDSLETLTAADLATISAGIDSLEASEKACNDALGRCETMVQAADARIWQVQEESRQKDAVLHQQSVVISRLQNLRGPSIGPVGWLGWAAAAAATVLLIVR